MPLTVIPTADRPPQHAADAIIVGVFEKQNLPKAAKEIDEAAGSALTNLLASGDVSAKLGSTAKLLHIQGMKSARLIVVGLGEESKFDAQNYLKACHEAYKALKTTPAKSVANFLPELDVLGQDAQWRTLQAVLALDQLNYRYVKTLKPNPNGNNEPTALHVPGKGMETAIQRALAISEGMNFARELGNLPPNICTPAYLAECASKLAQEHGTEIEILERDKMHELGMGSLLGVAQGSAHPPKLIVLKYQGAGKDEQPYVLVGKGITFDTGGISIKPCASMEEMKYDMLGAATAMATFLAVAKLKLPLNLVAIAPAVENMPDGASYRPGDVLQSMSGQTIEIVNTDAEGRLILCDALTYAQRFKPRALIDIATLTGACVVALGKHAHGLMSKHDDLAQELLAAGEKTLDRAWRLPVWDAYQQQLESAFADMANVGGRNAGAITAGCFLARFTEGQRWAHLDIAGTSWDEGRKGMATGRPVPLLVQWLLDQSGAG